MQQFKFLALFLLVFTFACQNATSVSDQNEKAPDPLRFSEDMDRFKKIAFDENTDRIVFTGSSSIRFWKNVQEYYPAHQIINTGFGGSEMSDLLYHIQDAVLRFAPTKVFIYEGDNDVNAKRTIPFIMDQTKKVVKAIEEKYPNCQIMLISAKPSLARWSLKSEYVKLNAKFKKFAQKKEGVEYVNIWDIMLDDSGKVRSDIFIEDGLHMNEAGYKLWDQVIGSFL